MPPVVADSTEELLSRYEELLRAELPDTLASLRPGLSDEAIDSLEKKNAFKLPADLRALYRWHDGASLNVHLEAFPNHRFFPLEVAIANRQRLRDEVEAGNFLQRQAYALLAGHREAWLGLVVDDAGDGYFFDPGRSEAEGSFFFCFAEDGHYVFYPEFRNYLAALAEGRKTGIFVAGSQGIETADFVKAQNLWLKYGASP